MKWLLIILALPIALLAQPAYSVIDIASGTSDFGTPWDLNDSGGVVGDLNFHAFYWHAGRVNQPPPLLTGFSTARAINNREDVAGSGQDEHSNAVAFLMRNGVVSELPVPGSTWAMAVAINDSGDTLINSRIGQRGTAFVWHEGALTEIGSESYSYLSGSGIDPGGRVVGTYVRPGDSFGRAFLWDGKLIDLGFLPGGDFTQDNPLNRPASIAYGLNTDGQGPSLLPPGGPDPAGGPAEGATDVNTPVASELVDFWAPFD